MSGGSLNRDLGGGLAAALHVVVASQVIEVSGADCRRWDVDRDELWAVGMHNLRRLPFRNELYGPAEAEIFFLTHDSYRAGTQMLRLGEIAGRPAPYGFLVLPISPYDLIYWRITGINLFQIGPALELLAGNLRSGHADDPSRWDGDVMWWFENRLERFTFNYSGKAAAGDSRGSIVMPRRFERFLTEWTNRPPA